jgi:hypothetical protein
MDGPAPLLWVGSRRTFDDPPKGFWVAVPVVLRRIIVEEPPDIPDSDPFARVVVNLAAAGVQRVPDIAELIGIEDLGFVNEVIRRLVERNIVALKSGVVELAERSDGIIGAVGEKKVWYGIQDVYSGSLWPRAATEVRRPEFDDDRNVVELGSPGQPAKRNFWRVRAEYTVEDPDAAAVRQALIRHLADLRTVGIKRSTATAQHLAFLGRPERNPVFSARLASRREEARLLVRLEATGDHISVVDPFEVGAWFELAHWTELLLEQSPALRDRTISWAARVSASKHEPADRPSDAAHATALGLPAHPDVTLSRPENPAPVQDRNTLLLSLADRLRDEIRRAAQSALGLSYDSDRDAATLRRRWAALGFRVPQQIVRPVPALIKRAAEGSPADLHALFYAWTLLVDLPDGQALALQAPDLPALLYDNARGRTRTAVPDLRPTTGHEFSLPTESRY